MTPRMMPVEVRYLAADGKTLLGIERMSLAAAACHEVAAEAGAYTDGKYRLRRVKKEQAGRVFEMVSTH